MTDTRPEGISYGANQHQTAWYMKYTSPGKDMDNFSASGHQVIRLNSSSQRGGDRFVAKIADQEYRFLDWLLESRIDPKGSWDIEVTSLLSNWTLLAAPIYRLPHVAVVCGSNPEAKKQAVLT